MNKLMAAATLAALSLAACAGNDLGSGVNTVDREYAKPASEVWSASLKSAEGAHLTLRSERHDKMGGEIVACRANGDEVRIDVISLTENSSRVSVRVGSGDRNLATMLQERIAEKTGLGQAKTGPFGGNSLEATYVADVESSVGSARRTLSALGVTATGEETHATSANVDGRLKDSTPVRIRMEKADDQKTRVTFIAGNEKNDDNKQFALKMKEEFERTAPLKGGN